jgi:hypothetical protein
MLVSVLCAELVDWAETFPREVLVELDVPAGAVYLSVGDEKSRRFGSFESLNRAFLAPREASRTATTARPDLISPAGVVEY